MKKKLKNLTEEQIDAIGDLLHENIQFYGRSDQPANAKTIAEIQKVLNENPLSERG
jgi:hypothetical protein